MLEKDRKNKKIDNSNFRFNRSIENHPVVVIVDDDEDEIEEVETKNDMFYFRLKNFEWDILLKGLNSKRADSYSERKAVYSKHIVHDHRLSDLLDWEFRERKERKKKRKWVD